MLIRSRVRNSKVGFGILEESKKLWGRVRNWWMYSDRILRMRRSSRQWSMRGLCLSNRSEAGKDLRERCQCWSVQWRYVTRSGCRGGTTSWNNRRPAIHYIKCLCMRGTVCRCDSIVLWSTQWGYIRSIQRSRLPLLEPILSTWMVSRAQSRL